MRLADLARLRQAAYRVFGEALGFPDTERRATLAGVARELHEQSAPLVGLAVFPRWMELLHALENVGNGAGRHLVDTYARLFVPSAQGQCHATASPYLAPDQPALLMARLEREYATSGFALAPASAQPPDHAAVEMDFMSLLCAEEAGAWTRQLLGEGVSRLDHEAGFLAGHLCCWFPEFARRVSTEDCGGFYALVTATARAFVVHDLDLVTALGTELREERSP